MKKQEKKGSVHAAQQQQQHRNCKVYEEQENVITLPILEFGY